MKRVAILSSLVLALTLTGCGLTNRTANAEPNAQKQGTVVRQSNSGQTMILGGTAYFGKAKLQHFIQVARQRPKDVQAQLDAARSAYVNGQYQLALNYYKKAATLEPKNGEIENFIGNVYLRGLNKPRAALPYYQKATRLSPKYMFGWLNLAITEVTLGNKAAARAVLKEGLQKVPKSDPNYKALQQELASLK
ncbi:hypothetical protein GCM10010885_24230 [Alicyclobacillus cellulosilyticus]|uniref:Tetratricopeptide repeat protein n=1 Tax=Alicyclobacillus cellulosilyticus TaxID=1003997 RepID=A0A917KIY3_9BACL|nr:tetratricopeptide repeat protein [Alicyclobacillus cellulosilyticus]GGJ14034.1 hypothetical protein GCM10010885_24230 [Alicyclobacillus cellulosilyticus]